MKKILIADDEKDIRDLTKEILECRLLDYSFETFEDGNCLKNKLNELIVKGDRNIRAIITDDNMPGIKGSELIEEYAKMKEFKKIPFFLVSSSDEYIGKRAMENGAFAYVQKPYNICEFSKLVEKAINSFEI
ncbi:MAG: response regulator [Nanoarchaeota archaeon]|nr:response regulator [Nanoarchaeota archaeon]